MVADIELEILDVSEIHARRLNAKGVHDAKMVNTSYSGRRWNSQVVWRKSGF